MSEGERRAQAVHAAAYRDSSERPPEALETLFREHPGSVAPAAYRITGDPADAEDVLQTVFTRLLRREEQPDLSESAGSYLQRAAVKPAGQLAPPAAGGRAARGVRPGGGLRGPRPGRGAEHPGAARPPAQGDGSAVAPPVGDLRPALP